MKKEEIIRALKEIKMMAIVGPSTLVLMKIFASIIIPIETVFGGIIALLVIVCCIIAIGYSIIGIIRNTNKLIKNEDKS